MRSNAFRRGLGAALSVSLALLIGCTEEGDTIIIQQGTPAIPPPPPPPFALTSSTPGGGAPAGGTTVQINGTSIDPGATVTFGAVAATGVTFLASTAISAVTPAGSGTVDIVVTNPGGAALTLTGAFTYDTPPVVTTSLAANTVAHVGDHLTFTVTATKAGSAGMRLRCLNAPPGCVCVPVVSSGSPATATVEWLVDAQSGGRRPLIFRAEEIASGAVGTRSVAVQVFGAIQRTAVVVADVTGDGVCDVVGGASAADAGGFAGNVGAVYVWAGQAVPSGTPTAVLRVTGAAAGDQLGLAAGQAIQCADVTGDGIDDVVVGASAARVGGVAGAGAVFVWAGGAGLTGTPAPTAVCARSAPTAGDRIGDASGQGILCCEVTGDSVLDIVAGAQWADVGGVADAGAVFVWAGGSALSGTVAPTATCAVTSPTAADRLGYVGPGQGVQCVEVTGDSVLDLIVGASLADAGATVDAGRAYVWAGGSGLTGAVAPTAVLAPTSPTAADQLGMLPAGTGIRCAEVSGDTVADVIVAGSLVDTGVADAGAVYVWTGGAAMTGTRAPSAALQLASPTASDQLGNEPGGGLWVAEVTGDTTLDVIVGGYYVDTSVGNAGGVYVWAGGSGLTGTVSPTASLHPASPTANDLLGYGTGRTIQVFEVTGDTTLDVVVTASYAAAGATQSGAVYVWAGGTGLSGVVAETARCGLASPTGGDLVGFTVGGQGVVCADVTGDGTRDVVAAAAYYDAAPGMLNTGGAFVWAGGSGLTGNVTPTATLLAPTPVANDQLGYGFGRMLVCADVTGDGTDDVLCGGIYADVAGTANVGVVVCWAGGSGLTGTAAPTATLTGGGIVGDYLGYATGQSILTDDVTGDGRLDVVVSGSFVDYSGAPNAGAIFVWAGGSGLTGAPGPTAALAEPPSPAFTQRALATAAGQGHWCADVTGDGVPDVLGVAPSSDLGTVTGAGAILAWSGGSGLTGTPAATAVLADANAYPADGLGN